MCATEHHLLIPLFARGMLGVGTRAARVRAKPAASHKSSSKQYRSLEEERGTLHARLRGSETDRTARELRCDLLRDARKLEGAVRLRGVAGRGRNVGDDGLSERERELTLGREQAGEQSEDMRLGILPLMKTGRSEQGKISCSWPCKHREIGGAKRGKSAAVEAILEREGPRHLAAEGRAEEEEGERRLPPGGDLGSDKGMTVRWLAWPGVQINPERLPSPLFLRTTMRVPIDQ